MMYFFCKFNNIYIFSNNYLWRTENCQSSLKSYIQGMGPMVLRRCRKLLNNEELALQAMQDTFVKVIENKSILTVAHPSSYFYRIATNISLNIIRKEDKLAFKDDIKELLYDIATSANQEIQASHKDLFSKNIS